MVRRIVEWLRALGDPGEPSTPDEPRQYGVWSTYTPQASVLIADDIAADAGRLGEPLQNAGFRVEVALTGTEAAAQLQAHRPDIIVMDRSLPGNRGFTTLNRLAGDPDTANIPVIMTTVKGSINPFWRIGDQAVSYLSHPFDPAQLLYVAQTLDFLRTIPQTVGGAVQSDTPADECSVSTILAMVRAEGLAGKIQQGLREAGYECVTVGTGSAGVQLARTMQPDLIVLDRYFDDMHGLEVLRELKTDALTQSISVVKITEPHAGISRAVWEPGNVGVAGFITIPFHPLELRRIVDRIAGKKRLYDDEDD